MDLIVNERMFGDNQMRVIEDSNNDDLYLFAVDVCRSLQYKNPSKVWPELKKRNYSVLEGCVFTNAFQENNNGDYDLLDYKGVLALSSIAMKDKKDYIPFVSWVKQVMIEEKKAKSKALQLKEQVTFVAGLADGIKSIVDNISSIPDIIDVVNHRLDEMSNKQKNLHAMALNQQALILSRIEKQDDRISQLEVEFKNLKTMYNKEPISESEQAIIKSVCRQAAKFVAAVEHTSSRSALAWVYNKVKGEIGQVKLSSIPKVRMQDVYDHAQLIRDSYYTRIKEEGIKLT